MSNYFEINDMLSGLSLEKNRRERRERKRRNLL